jgi:threonine/homoserine/homoserine lactone efflux protein
MPVKDYASFVITVWLFLALPGPGNLAILAAYRSGGLKAAMISTLGIAFGDQLLILMALGGLAAILEEAPLIFRWVEMSGAAYLVYLGLSLMRHSEEIQKESVMALKDSFTQSLWITLLNPKAIIFYMAFFPLFIDKGRQIDVQTWAILAGTIALLTLLYGVFLLLILRVVSRRLQEMRSFKKYMSNTLGVLFIGLGIKLAFS